MTLRFSVVDRPGHDILDPVADLSPDSPFNTVAYADALAASSGTPCALLLSAGDDIVGGCLAHCSGSRWNRKLEIFSAPSLPEPGVFWQGLADYCRQSGIRELAVESFASQSPDMPELKCRLSRRDRLEFVLKLDPASNFDRYSNNHRRSIRKARKAGLTVKQSAEFDDYVVHVDLMRQSMVRRERRGERVVLPSQRDFDFALLSSGAGILFQGERDGATLTSILILLAADGGYYQSAGTSPEGMKIGASPMLINAVAEALADSGRSVFNLGGVDPGADGLHRFKAGFGTREIALHAEKYAMTSILRYRLTDLAISFKDLGSRVLSVARPGR